MGIYTDFKLLGYAFSMVRRLSMKFIYYIKFYQIQKLLTKIYNYINYISVAEEAEFDGHSVDIFV